MATATIDGTALSTYGLRLAKFDGNLSLPAYKNIIENSDLEAELRILDEKNVSVELIGKYASPAALGSAIQSFQTKIRGEIKYRWVFSLHSFSEFCVVKSGMTVNIHRGNIAVVRFTLTVTSET